MPMVIFILFTLLVSCSEPPSSQPTKNDTPERAEAEVQKETWTITSNNEKMRTAKVNAIGSAGNVKATLMIFCPQPGSEAVATFEYYVHEPDKIQGFDFDYFEGPGAPALKRELVEIKVKDESELLSWRFKAASGRGGLLEADTFFFSPNTFNKPDKTDQILSLITRGGTEITLAAFNPHDDKSITATFPPIEKESEVARILAGCGAAM